jgi:hypothetical protein
MGGDWIAIHGTPYSMSVVEVASVDEGVADALVVASQ